MKQTIEYNARVLRGLHEAIHTTYLCRAESVEAREAYRNACEEFHRRYDALAFPGGISAAFERLRAGDTSIAETVIIYLEIHPYFFRSQYHATQFIRLLKKLHLRSDLQERFAAVRAAARERKIRRKAAGS